jgi:hypothetical protein
MDNGRHIVRKPLSAQEPKSRDARTEPLSNEELELINGYWWACNYLSVGMIYLKDNPLLREPLRTEHVKHRLLGHWGTSPALSFIWVKETKTTIERDHDDQGGDQGNRVDTTRQPRQQGRLSFWLYSVCMSSPAGCNIKRLGH